MPPSLGAGLAPATAAEDLLVKTEKDGTVIAGADAPASYGSAQGAFDLRPDPASLRDIAARLRDGRENRGRGSVDIPSAQVKRGQYVRIAKVMGQPYGARSRIKKRSVIVAGRQSSVSLEDEFWNEVRKIAHLREQSMQEFVADVLQA